MKRAWFVVLPLLAIALVVTAAVIPDSTAPAGRNAEQIPTVETTFSCPTRGTSPFGEGTIALGQVAPGESREIARVPEGEVAARLEDPAGWSTAAVGGDGVLVTQTGRGSGASGYFGGRSSDRQGGGLGVGRCPGLVDDGWFLGLGSADRHFSTIVLTNLSSSPAVADLRLWNEAGPIDAVDARDLTLEPGEVRAIALTDLAAGERTVAVQVQRRRGSMSAVVLDRSTATRSGADALGATVAPRRDQYVGGVGGAARGKSLLVVNPGSTTARVDVEVLTGTGRFAARGLQGVKVEAGQYREVEVPASVGAGPQAFHLRSDRPVAASVRMTSSDTDYSVAEASEPFAGPVIVPVDLGDDVGRPRLVLTAPAATATVEVEVRDRSMQQIASSTVQVPAGTTVLDAPIDSDAPWADEAAYVVLRAKGAVVGAAYFTGDDRVSSLALQAAPVTVAAPSVQRGN